jgi:hypothetical protein
MDEWPMYELANYANSGLLLDKCRAAVCLAASDSEPPPGEGRRGALDRAVSSDGGAHTGCNKRGANRASYCTATSGYQTLEEQQQQQQQQQRQEQTDSLNAPRPTMKEAHADQEDLSERPPHHSGGRSDDVNRPPGRANKSRPKQNRQTAKGRPALAWWHLIERVNYGKLDGESGRARPAAGRPLAGQRDTAAVANMIDWQLDRLFRTRLIELCHEISRLVR